MSRFQTPSHTAGGHTPLARPAGNDGLMLSPFADGEPGEERGKDELAAIAAEHAQHGRHQRDEGIEKADTQVDEAVVPLGLHGPRPGPRP